MEVCSNTPQVLLYMHVEICTAIVVSGLENLIVLCTSGLGMVILFLVVLYMCTSTRSCTVAVPSVDTDLYGDS